MMQIFNFKSLSTKLFLIILIAILPLLVLALYTAHQERASKIEEAKNEALHQAGMIAESQEQMIDQVAILLDAAAAGDRVIHDPATCSAFLSNLLHGKTEYVNLLIVQTDGTVSCSANTPVDWVPEAVMLDQVLQTEGVFPVRHQANEPNEMVVLSRFLDAQGIPSGVGAALLRPHWLSDQVSILQESDPGSEMLIVDATGNVLNQSTPIEVDLQGHLTARLRTAIQSGQETIQATGSDGVERFYGIHRLPFGLEEATVYVLVGLPVTRVTHTANAYLKLDLLAIGFALLVSLVAAFVTEKWLVLRWLQPLIRTAQRLEAGDFSVRTSIKERENELGQLAYAFDSMAERIERNTAELQEAVARYHNLFTGVPVGLYRTMPEGRILDANPALKELLGISDSEPLGMLNVSTFFVDPEERQRWVEAMAREGEIINFELHLCRLDGESIFVLDNARTVRNAEGVVEYYEGSLLDITQRKQTGLALRESNEHLNSVLSSITEAYIALDSQAHLIEANPVAIRDYFGGRPAIDLVGKNIWEDFPQAVQTEFYRQYQIATAKGCPVHFEAQSHLNGRWWETHAYPAPGKLEVYLRDITERKQAEAAIINARDYYLTLFEEFPALVWRSRLDAKCDYLNQTWLKFTGRTAEQESGDGWTEGVHPEDLERCLSTYLEAFAARQPFEMEYRLRRHDGEYRWITDFGRPFFSLEGEFTGYIGSCYDITDRKRAEQAIAESEKRYRQLIELAPDTIFVQCDGRIIYINRAGLKFLGADNPKQLLEEPVLDLILPEYHAVAEKRILRLDEITQSLPPIEITCLRLDGTSVEVEAVAAPISFKEKMAAQVILRDITERKRTEAYIRELAYHDPLTGLFNRKAFQDELERWLSHVRRSAKKLTVLFLDLDNFKNINDRYGHNTGDSVLVEAANRLRTVVRKEDIVSRLGGDEFILLAEINGKEDAEAIAERILGVFCVPFQCSNTSFKVTPSIGISIFPDDGNDPETLVQKADHAMYAVKRSGKAGYSCVQNDKNPTDPKSVGE